VENQDFVIVEKKYFGNVLSEYKGKSEEVVVPEGVAVIGRRAFKDMSFIRSVILPQSVITIESEAFANTSIESIILPQRTYYVGGKAFEGCKKLKRIEIQCRETGFGETPFFNAAEEFELIYGGTKARFEEEAMAHIATREYQSGDYHHPTATHFEYYKIKTYSHIFCGNDYEPFTCTVKCADGELTFHAMPYSEKEVKTT